MNKTYLSQTLSLIIICFFSLSTFARNWTKVKIPGAVCGDGSTYFVFIDENKKSDQLLVEFMGGGACWSYETCFKGDRKTWVHPIPELPSFSYLTNDNSDHPFQKDSAIYFPYCSGDVFSADHVATYQDKTAYHQGYRNVQLSLKYLNEKYLNLFQRLNRLTVFGTSAGAIGALVHLNSFNEILSLSPNIQKYAIIDSPGLHFGSTFWNKFTPDLIKDYKKSFNHVGLFYPEGDGFLAQYMGLYFQQHSDWKIGLLQSTRDQTMSLAFGDISQDDHDKLVLSDKGIVAIAQPYAHVKTWISHSEKHIFLIWSIYADFYKDKNKKSASRFVKELMR